MTDSLKTGDLLLFSEDSAWSFMGVFTSLIKWGTHSNYTHVAVVLKDPTFLHPSLDGLYVWESSWEGKPDPEDGKIKLGVQITPLAEILEAYKGKGQVFVRSVEVPEGAHPFRSSVLSTIHRVVHDKPYDLVPKDWFAAFIQSDADPQKISRFWCSALVGYIYTIAGVLAPSTDWSILRPSDFSLAGERLAFSAGFSLGSSEWRLLV
jgi:cell wall-associated NlpC family hydrolase